RWVERVRAGADVARRVEEDGRRAGDTRAGEHQEAERGRGGSERDSTSVTWRPTGASALGTTERDRWVLHHRDLPLVDRRPLDPHARLAVRWRAAGGARPSRRPVKRR